MKLTDKQENFKLAYVLNGRNASAAYRECYDVGEDTQPSTVWANAHKLLKNTEVARGIEEISEQRFNGKIMSVKERKKILSELASNSDMKAIDMLNKMDGVYVEKQEITATQEVHYYAPKKDEDK